MWDFPIERQCLQIKSTYWFSTHWFRLCDLLWGQNSVAKTKDWPFLYYLDGLGQTFRVRIVMRIKTGTRRIMRLDGHFHKNSPYQYKQSDLSLQCIAATGCCNQSPDLFTRSDLSPRRVAATCRLVCSDL